MGHDRRYPEITGGHPRLPPVQISCAKRHDPNTFARHLFSVTTPKLLPSAEPSIAEQRGCCFSAPTPVTIPSSSAPNNSAQIPLRTLPTSHWSDPPPSSSSGSVDEKPLRKRRSSRSSRLSADSARSDLSLWSDSGDLAERHTHGDETLQLRLRPSSEDQLALVGREKRPKRVCFEEEGEEGEEEENDDDDDDDDDDDRAALRRHRTRAGLDREQISIPVPRPRRVSRFEQSLAAVMAGGQAKAGHGLVGKPLL